MNRLLIIAGIGLLLGGMGITPLYADAYADAYAEAYSRRDDEIGRAPNDNSCNFGALEAYSFTYNSRCDDGGAGTANLSPQCGYATDAADCGIRSATEIASFRAAAADAYAAPFAEAIAAGHADDYADAYARVYAVFALAPNDNACDLANDGDCDDGGDGPDFGLCRLGTDAADCGIRGVTESTPIYAHAYVRAINNTQNSTYARVYALLIVDGESEAYAEIYAAAYADLSTGDWTTPHAIKYAAAYAAAYFEAIDAGHADDYADAYAETYAVFELTNVPNDNSCVDANDGFCDDGGPGFNGDICDLGTDVIDCGIR